MLENDGNFTVSCRKVNKHAEHKKRVLYMLHKPTTHAHTHVLCTFFSFWLANGSLLLYSSLETFTFHHRCHDAKGSLMVSYSLCGMCHCRESPFLFSTKQRALIRNAASLVFIIRPKQ